MDNNEKNKIITRLDERITQVTQIIEKWKLVLKELNAVQKDEDLPF